MEIIKSLQFCKLTWQANKNTEKWMGTIGATGIECNYVKVQIAWFSGSLMEVNSGSPSIVQQ